MLILKTNLFLNFNQKCLHSTIIFFTKFKSYEQSSESYNRVLYNVFG